MKVTNLAIVFPGQGSQSVGMLDDLADGFAVVRDTFAEASDVLERDLWSLVTEGPKSTLDQTQVTQPVMLAAGVAIWRCWQELGGPLPAMMAGHSLGEYSALVCADAVTFADAVRLIEVRSRLMQRAVPEGEGAMAAVLGLDNQQVVDLCREQAQGQVLEAVNFNAPMQVVIAGDRDAIKRGIAAAKEAGAKRAIQLPISVPCHSSLLRAAADELAQSLADTHFSMPSAEILLNVTVTSPSDPDDLRMLLTRQLHSPVRWVETVQAMAARGISTMIESGPGKVLTGLGKRINRQINALPVFDRAGMEKAMEAIANAE
ncbi:MAG TPA: [acyl-carrier-protein] S-malonyltransferase [Chromatiaceae bacterium]|jgi:[acyl-carrier-protein] S-malonyltransferase|nr:MAG: ACP S-malonyltransferase [Thiohalocapsa sp. PB-PSB1]HBG95965.1 [acyl-carrier-protein] S-malonyltransferase [Chromatiaceae bacterium]